MTNSELKMDWIESGTEEPATALDVVEFENVDVVVYQRSSRRQQEAVLDENKSLLKKLPSFQILTHDQSFKANKNERMMHRSQKITVGYESLLLPMGVRMVGVGFV